MINSLQKYRIKLILRIAALFIAVVMLIAVSLNVVFLISKNKIAQLINVSFAHKLSIGGIFYAPPDYIILKDVSISKTHSPLGKQFVFIPKAKLQFSFLKLFFKRQVFISEIYLYKPQSDYSQISSFVINNFKKIVEFIERLPKQNIKLYVKKSKLRLATDEKNERFITITSTLRLKNDDLLIYAMCSEDGQRSGKVIQGIPFRFGFKGAFTNRGLFIEKLECRRENLYSQVWGNFDRNVFYLKGFMFVNTRFKEYEYEEPVVNIVKKIKSFIESLRSPGEVEELPRANLYILDVDSKIAFDFPKVNIDHLNFSLNNHPIKLKGMLSFAEPCSLDIKASTYLTPLGEVQVENLKKIDLGIKGTLKDNIFEGSMVLNLDFVKKKKGSPPLQKAEIGLQELSVAFTRFPRVTIHFGGLNVFLRTDSNEYRVSLKDFFANLYLKKDRFQFIEFNSQFYDGYLRGRGRIDMIKLPPKITSVVRIKDVSANKLAGILVHFSKVYGKLDSLMYFNNYPHLDLEGKMVVQNGYLKNFEFFKWLASFLDLEALKKIDFNRSYSCFSVNKEGASLHEIDLNAQDVKINGYFNLGEEDKVTSKLTLMLTKELLQQSQKVTPLLRLIKEDVNHLSFDFKLSGNLHGMNFQWLESDFKRTLQDSIPSFIERKIEKNVEDFIGTMHGQ